MSGKARSITVLALSGLNLLLLALYATSTNLVPTPRAWVATFTWAPAPHVFSLPAFASRCGGWSLEVLVFILWLTAALGLGNRLLRRWFAELGGDGSEKAVVAVGLGLGTLSLAGFLLGAAHLLYPGVIGLLGAGAFTAAVWPAPTPHLRASAPTGDAGDAAAGGPLPLRQRVGAWFFTGQVTRHLRAASQGDGLSLSPLLILCLTSLVFHLLGILPPPVAFDEMSYQLALPRLYLMNHGFVDTPFNHLSYLPQNITMLFTLGLATGGFVTAKLFSLTLSLLAVAGVFIFGRRLVGGKAALVAACLFMLTPVVGNQFRLAISDPGAGFYELIGVFLLLKWLEEPPSPGGLTLASLFWGLALGAKYTVLPGFLIATVVLATALVYQRRRHLLLRSLARFTLPALLVWLPWLAKNWWYTGNPVAPLFSTWLPSRNFMFAGNYAPLVDYAAGRGIPQYFPLHGPADLLALPWHLATRHNDFNHDLGPALLLCLVLLPVAIGSLARNRKLLHLIVALYWLAWLFAGVRMTRYFTAGLALSSLLGGAVVAAAASRERRWVRALVFLPFLLALGSQAMRIVAYQNTFKKPWGYLAARCSQAEYLDRLVSPDPPLRAYRFINGQLPPDARVLVAQEFRTLYLERDFLASTPWDHDYWHEFVRLSRNPVDLVRRLKARGVTHVFINTYYLEDKTGKAFLADWTDGDLEKSRQFLLECFEPLYFEDGLWVGRVEEPDRS